MRRTTILTTLASLLLALTSPALAETCKDVSGKLVMCRPAPGISASKCRDAMGHWANCPAGGGGTGNTGFQAIARPKGAPPNAKAQCKDGTFFVSELAMDACVQHGGVAHWYQ